MVKLTRANIPEFRPFIGLQLAQGQEAQIRSGIARCDVDGLR